ncbi:MAG: hypothetical protein ACRDHW_17580 [Ktedonobacteraceae bacterium]
MEDHNAITPIIVEYNDNFLPAMPAGYAEHTPAYPFCRDMTCPCHRDLEALARIAWAHHEGLCTAEEAGRIIAGLQF